MAPKTVKNIEPVPKAEAPAVEGMIPNIFGPEPLLLGENPRDYHALLDRVTAAVQPHDILEEIWVRDAVDHTWEVLRLRRMKAQLLNSSVYKGLRTTISPFVDQPRHPLFPSFGEPVSDPVGDIVSGWVRGEPEAKKKTEQILASANLTMDRAMALTLVDKLDDFERIDRLLASAEARRNSALHEIERHRETFAANLRHAAAEVEDAEFREIGPTEGQSGKT